MDVAASRHNYNSRGLETLPFTALSNDCVGGVDVLRARPFEAERMTHIRP